MVSFDYTSLVTSVIDFLFPLHKMKRVFQKEPGMASNRAPAARMKLLHKSENFPELTRVFKSAPAVVNVNKGESQEQAWLRHVNKHPEDKSAIVKVFNYSP
jgi:hypothetical protein